MKSLTQHLCVKLNFATKLCANRTHERVTLSTFWRCWIRAKKRVFRDTHTYVWCNVIATMKQFRKSYEPVFEFHDTIFHSYRIFSNNSYASLIIQRRSWESDWLFRAIKFFLLLQREQNIYTYIPINSAVSYSLRIINFIFPWYYIFFFLFPIYNYRLWLKF